MPPTHEPPLKLGNVGTVGRPADVFQFMPHRRWKAGAVNADRGMRAALLLRVRLGVLLGGQLGFEVLFQAGELLLRKNFLRVYQVALVHVLINLGLIKAMVGLNVVMG